MRSSKLALEVVQRSYATSEIPVEEFLRLEDYDEWLEDRGSKTLTKALEEAGCENIEWNGHFGPHVYFSLGAEDDTLRRRSRVLRTITSYTQRAVRWAAKREA